MKILVKTQRDLSLFHLQVYLFPITAAMHYNKLLEGLKQHKFSQLQFWRPEVQNQFHWKKIKVSAGLVSSRDSLSKPIYLIFPAFRDCLYSLLWGHFPLSSNPAM